MMTGFSREIIGAAGMSGSASLNDPLAQGYATRPRPSAFMATAIARMTANVMQ